MKRGGIGKKGFTTEDTEFGKEKRGHRNSWQAGVTRLRRSPRIWVVYPALTGWANFWRVYGAGLAGLKTHMLFGVDEQDEGVGDDGGAGTRVVRSGGGSRAVIGGDGVDGVSGVVEGHGAGATLSLNHFH